MGKKEDVVFVLLFFFFIFVSLSRKGHRYVVGRSVEVATLNYYYPPCVIGCVCRDGALLADPCGEEGLVTHTLAHGSGRPARRCETSSSRRTEREQAGDASEMVAY